MLTSETGGISRRTVLKAAGIGALSLSAAPLLAACTSSTSKASKTISDGTPKRGGRLRVGITGGGTNDTLDPSAALTYPSYAAGALLYDSLSGLNRDGQIELRLAKEITPSADAKSWTIRLRNGVQWHDGRSIDADDLIYTFRHVTNASGGSVNAAMLAQVDVAGIKKLDTMTVRVPCKAPFSTLLDILSTYNFFCLLPAGYNPKKPVGTGPYKFVSHTPGQQLVVQRNDNYWVTGQPYLDSVVITDYPDETSQINALLAGQVDVITQLTAASLPQLAAANATSVVSKGGGWTPIVMRTDIAPFNNPDVVTAMKLAVDRQQMLDSIFNGQGAIANDLFGAFDPAFNHNIQQRQHDPDQAKFLLKRAGAEGLTVDFTTSTVAVGTTQLASVFAQQAKTVGVTVNVKQIDPSAFFGPSWLSRSLTTDFWAYAPYFSQAIQSNYPGMFDETHWDNSQWSALYRQAQSTVSAERRKPLVAEMQQLEWDKSGYIIPYYYPVIDGFSSKVRGAKESKLGFPLNFFADFKTLYFA
jgi:peptide/nickel transport system substrate-binding protein